MSVVWNWRGFVVVFSLFGHVYLRCALRYSAFELMYVLH